MARLGPPDLVPHDVVGKQRRQPLHVAVAERLVQPASDRRVRVLGHLGTSSGVVVDAWHERDALRHPAMPGAQRHRPPLSAIDLGVILADEVRDDPAKPRPRPGSGAAGVVEALGQGKQPPVSITIGGYTYRSTVAPYRTFMLPLAASTASPPESPR
jgi:hypothetical protein